MTVKDKVFLVVGTGKSGIAAACLLLSHEAKVILYDSFEALDIVALCEKNPCLRDLEIVAGKFPQSCVDSLDVVVLSPGVPCDLPLVEHLKKEGVSVWGEIELAYRLGKGKIAAITGTNGKTTTTSLVGEIMRGYFSDVKVVGNIGIPYTQVVDETKDDTVIAAEISSFQLETMDQFAPKVSAILNITPDHLDRASYDGTVY